MSKSKKIIGWSEWVQLPQIGLPLIKAKCDTGARTSALHAFDIQTFAKKGSPWVRFKIHPLQGTSTLTIECEAPVVDRRLITDSGGKGEKRLVIETFATVGDMTRAIEITLTNREKMAFRMLLGRQAMEKFGFAVDPGHTSLLAKIKSGGAKNSYLKKKPKLILPREKQS
jgi:hypothetical protein